MKYFIAILLIALFAVAFVSCAQQQVEADNIFLDILKGAAKDYVNKNWDNEEQADAEFFKKLGKLFKKALPYLKAGVKDYVNNNFDEAADFKFGKLFKKIGKIGLKLGKAYLRTKGIPLEDNEQADKFWKKLWGVVKQVGKGAIKSYVNQNFDAQSDLTLPKAEIQKLWRFVCKFPRPVIKPAIFRYTKPQTAITTAADFKFGKLFKKIGKIGLKLGKAYLRTKGIPLSDLAVIKPTGTGPRRRKFIGRSRRCILRKRLEQVEADNFLLDILKGAAKDYVNKNWDNEEQADAEFFKKLGKLFKKALPYLKAGVKDYVNNNFDEEADLSIRFPIDRWINKPLW
ncbi:hypothetical protein ABK040_000104 [Willaertia magna]